MGRYGDVSEEYSWFIGNGTSPVSRGLGAKWLASTGDMYVDGTFVPGGADYAEMFETTNGLTIEPGYFVTTSGGKIRIATTEDPYLLGVTSSTPSILADSAEMQWKNKYLTDEWGRLLKEMVKEPAQYDWEGRLIKPESVLYQSILNPEWNPEKDYIPRRQRPEWVSVGMLGKLRVRDDGSCIPDGFCNPNDQGVATSSDTGYRVLERTGPNQILIVFK